MNYDCRVFSLWRNMLDELHEKFIPRVRFIKPKIDVGDSVVKNSEFTLCSTVTQSLVAFVLIIWL